MYRPYAFRVSYEDDYHHRTPTACGMDSEYSHTTRKLNSQIVVAHDLATAQFLWTKRKGSLPDVAKVEWEELGAVTIMMEEGYGIY